MRDIDDCRSELFMKIGNLQPHLDSQLRVEIAQWLIEKENLAYPLTNSELADELGVSPRKLSRACNREFGQSPMRLHMSVRFQAARNFLFYDDFSIRDVALACGFSYTAVFSKVFKRQLGQTPREFRSRLRERQNLAFRPELPRSHGFRVSAIFARSLATPC